MSDIVIAAENLSKSYLVGHQSAERERYTALRDVIAREARNFTRKTVDVSRVARSCRGRGEEFWALKDVSFEVKRRGRRHHWSQWRWQKYAFEDPISNHRADRGA